VFFRRKNGKINRYVLNTIVLMPYPFSFDLTKISRSFFREVARISYDKEIHKKVGDAARYLIQKFRIRELTGLDLSDAVRLMEDFIDVQVTNMRNKTQFLKTKKRALFLPHCSRKFMDGRCKAIFDPEIPTYRCSHCSSDCPVHQATLLGEKNGYDVYIIPGGSCIKEILEKNRYEAVVGVACGMEIMLAKTLLSKLRLPGQAVPLIKNGCANTKFNLETLEKILRA